jgi:hypothetical protein
LVVNDAIDSSTPSTVTVTVAAPSLQLFAYDIVTNYTALPLPYMPYSAPSNDVVNAVFSGSSDYSIQLFKLKAVGSRFTISNVTASDSTDTIVPVFNGIYNGAVISAGNSLSFSIMAPHTFGKTTSLSYSFKIAETGQTFVYYANFTSN